MIVAKSNEQQLLNNEDLVCSVIITLKQPRDDLISEKEAILHKMSMLTAQIQQCNDVTALRAVKTHISFARSILHVISDETGPTYTTTSNEASNKKVVPQQRFRSTKKRSRSTNVRLAKPSPGEKNIVCHSLMEMKELYPAKEIKSNNLTLRGYTLSKC